VVLIAIRALHTQLISLKQLNKVVSISRVVLRMMQISLTQSVNDSWLSSVQEKFFDEFSIRQPHNLFLLRELASLTFIKHVATWQVVIVSNCACKVRHSLNQESLVRIVSLLPLAPGFSLQPGPSALRSITLRCWEANLRLTSDLEWHTLRSFELLDVRRTITVEVVKQLKNTTTLHHECPDMATQGRHSCDDLEEGRVVLIVGFGEWHHVEEKQDQVTNDCLAWHLHIVVYVGPIVVELLLFNSVHFQHGTVDQTCQNHAHWFLTTLEEALLNQGGVYELSQEPLGKLGLVVHVRLEVANHRWQVSLRLSTQQH